MAAEKDPKVGAADNFGASSSLSAFVAAPNVKADEAVVAVVDDAPNENEEVDKGAAVVVAAAAVVVVDAAVDDVPNEKVAAAVVVTAAAAVVVSTVEGAPKTKDDLEAVEVEAVEVEAAEGAPKTKPPAGLAASVVVEAGVPNLKDDDESDADAATPNVNDDAEEPLDAVVEAAGAPKVKLEAELPEVAPPRLKPPVERAPLIILGPADVVGAAAAAVVEPAAAPGLGDSQQTHFCLSPSFCTMHVSQVHFAAAGAGADDDDDDPGLGVSQQTHLSLSLSFCTMQVSQSHLAAAAKREGLKREPPLPSFGKAAVSAAGFAAGFAVLQQTQAAQSSSLETRQVPQVHLGPAGFLTVKRSWIFTTFAAGFEGAAAAAPGFDV